MRATVPIKDKPFKQWILEKTLELTKKRGSWNREAGIG